MRLFASVDTGQSEFVLTSLPVTVTRFSAVLMSKTFWARYENLVHIDLSICWIAFPWNCLARCWFLQWRYFRIIVRDNLHLVKTSDELNIWFVIVFVVTEVLDSHQHPARLSFHRVWDSICIGRIYKIANGVVPRLACTILSSICYFVIYYMSRFIKFHQHPVSVCKLVRAKYCFQIKSNQIKSNQIKSSFEDRIIASILGKSSDVAFKISVS